MHPLALLAIGGRIEGTIAVHRGQCICLATPLCAPTASTGRRKEPCFCFFPVLPLARFGLAALAERLVDHQPVVALKTLPSLVSSRFPCSFRCGGFFAPGGENTRNPSVDSGNKSSFRCFGSMLPKFVAKLEFLGHVKEVRGQESEPREATQIKFETDWCVTLRSHISGPSESVHPVWVTTYATSFRTQRNASTNRTYSNVPRFREVLVFQCIYPIEPKISFRNTGIGARGSRGLQKR